MTTTNSTELAKAFEQLVRQSFAFLEKEFAFRHVATEIQLPEMWVTFHNPTTYVIVTWEVGSSPWVEVGKLEEVEGKWVHRGRASLELLLAERAPEESMPPTVIVEIGDPELRRILDKKAEQLCSYGSDLLEGDFNVLRRLKELAEENQRKWEQETFGPKQ